MRKRDI